MLIASPVCGLRPVRAARSLANRIPTLSMRALFPAAISLSMVARNSVRSVLVIFLGSLSVNLSATAEISCCVETVLLAIATPLIEHVGVYGEISGCFLANQVSRCIFCGSFEKKSVNSLRHTRIELRFIDDCIQLFRA